MYDRQMFVFGRQQVFLKVLYMQIVDVSLNVVKEMQKFVSICKSKESTTDSNHKEKVEGKKFQKNSIRIRLMCQLASNNGSNSSRSCLEQTRKTLDILQALLHCYSLGVFAIQSSKLVTSAWKFKRALLQQEEPCRAKTLRNVKFLQGLLSDGTKT